MMVGEEPMSAGSFSRGGVQSGTPAQFNNVFQRSSSSTAPVTSPVSRLVSSPSERTTRGYSSSLDGPQDCQPLCRPSASAGLGAQFRGVGYALSEVLGWLGGTKGAGSREGTRHPERAAATQGGSSRGGCCNAERQRAPMAGRAFAEASSSNGRSVSSVARHHDLRRKVTGTICRQVRYDDELPNDDILSLQDIGGRTFVRHLKKSGQAERSGVRVGDELVQIKSDQATDSAPSHLVDGSKTLLDVKPPVVLLFMGFAGRFPAEVKVPYKEPSAGLFSSAEEVVGGANFDLCDQVVFRAGDAPLFLALQEAPWNTIPIGKGELPPGDLDVDPTESTEASADIAGGSGRIMPVAAEGEDDFCDREGAYSDEEDTPDGERMYELKQKEARLVLHQAMTELSSARSRSRPVCGSQRDNENQKMYRNAFGADGPRESQAEAAQNDLGLGRLRTSGLRTSGALGGKAISQGARGATAARSASKSKGAASRASKLEAVSSPRDLARSVPRRPLSPPRDMELTLNISCTSTRPATANRGASDVSRREEDGANGLEHPGRPRSSRPNVSKPIHPAASEAPAGNDQEDGPPSPGRESCEGLDSSIYYDELA